jgi:hypothetical protein
MKIVLAVLLLMSSVIGYVAWQEDKTIKGFKKIAKDGDADGLVQDGTRWERKA